MAWSCTAKIFKPAFSITPDAVGDTRATIQAGKQLDVELVYHLIIGSG